MNTDKALSNSNEPLKAKLLSNALIVFTGISGAIAVLLGAWLSHMGQNLAPEMQHRLSSALNYQFFHTLALLITLVWYRQSLNKLLLFASFGFFIGILAFSGSLYVKTFLSFAPIGKLAPFGGITLVLSWLIIAFVGFKNK